LLYLRQKQLIEESEMSALFPTFTSWLGQVKRFLSTDSRDMWQRIYEAIQEDEERYQQQLQAKGIDFII
jgi:hypothetical protein